MDTGLGLEAGPKVGYRNPWLMVAVASLANLALYIVLFGVPPIITSLVKDPGLTHEQAGLLMTVSLAAYCVCSVIGGILSDRLGARPVVSSGLLLASVAGYLFTWTDSFFLMLVFRTLVGVGAACVFAPGLRFILASVPKEISGVGMSWYMISINAGAAVPLLVTPLMTSAYEWEVLLQVYALFGGLIAVLFWCVAQETPPSGLRASVASGLSQGKTMGFWSLPLLLVSVASLLRMSQTYGILTWAPAYLSEAVKFSPAEVATAMTVLSMSPVPALLVGGWLSDRTSRKVTLAIGGLLISSSAVLLAGLHGGSFGVVTAVAFATGFGAGISSVPIFSLPAMAVSPSHVGRATGFVSTMTFAGPILTAYLGGYVVTATGKYDLAFLAFGLAPALAALMLAPLVKSFRPRW